MPTAENARLQYEGGQTAVPMSTLTDSGDHIKFTSPASQWSGKSGSKPDVKPDGLASGGIVSAPGVGNDLVDVASLSVYLAGVKTAVTASLGETILRPTGAFARTSSVTVTTAGAIAIVAGLEALDAIFTEVRGGAGGPPYIPVDSIEVAQVRLNSAAAAIILSTEIFQVVGLHSERFDFPIWVENSSAGEIDFSAALSLIHAADVPKQVSASYSEPVYTDVQLAADFVPPETTHSQNSTPVYGGTIGSSTQALNQGTFTAFLRNGVDDPLVQLKNENLWFKFFPDRFESQHILTQGLLGVARTFPAGDSIQAACTVTAAEKALDIAA